MKKELNNVTEIKLIAADGYPLSALKYHATRPIRGHMVVAGATGVPQLFYRHFAEFAAAKGYEVLTFDYRGIGKSKPPSLRGFQMQYLDWAFQDLSSAINAMASKEMPLFLVGHSFAGHAFGLIPNHACIARFYTFGTGAGWHGWMPKFEQLKVLVMWHLVGPLITCLKGYLAWSKIGMGEDLPLGVYRDWKRWCQYPRYFFNDPTMTHIQKHFDSITTPIIAANSTDDLWAQPKSRDAFMSGYRNTNWSPVNINPDLLELGSIGHMGYFRRHAEPLWNDVIDWFEQHEKSSDVLKSKAI